MTLADMMLAALVAMQVADRLPRGWGRRLLDELVPGDDG